MNTETGSVIQTNECGKDFWGKTMILENSG